MHTSNPQPIGCDLLKNSYLCLLNNTHTQRGKRTQGVVICWKIRIFAYWTTPKRSRGTRTSWLWFAEKFVSLLIEQHQIIRDEKISRVVICWKIRIFAYWTTPNAIKSVLGAKLWFAEKFVSLLIEQHQERRREDNRGVVICWKIRIFAYWTTPWQLQSKNTTQLWFAEKFVSLLIEQHPESARTGAEISCDLLKNSYLCLLNNTLCRDSSCQWSVVICWKIRIFAYWTTPWRWWCSGTCRCDLLKNSYLCLLNNTIHLYMT